MAEKPEAQKDTQERHGRYFMEYFARQDARLRGPEQQKAIAALSNEMDNFRTAWVWSIEHKEFDLIEHSLRAFETFFDARGWLHEGLAYLTDALHAVDHSGRQYPLQRGHILISQSLLLFRLARMDQALANLEQSLEIVRPLDHPEVLVEGVSFLGIVFAMMGKYADALPLFYEGLELARASDDQWFEALSMTEIVSIEIMAGEAENPYQRLQSALAAWRATGDPRFTAFGLNTLSLSAVRLGRLDEARAALEESIAINQSVGDHWGLGTAYRGLGLVEQEQGRHEEAVEAFGQSQTILADLGARWDVARVLGEKGRSVFALEKVAEAEAIWREAIRLGVEVQGTPLILESIVGIGNVHVRRGDLPRAYELFQVVANHPASVQETRSRATKALKELEGRLTKQELDSIQAGSGGTTLDAIVAGILHSV